MRLEIELRPELYQELVEAAAMVRCPGVDARSTPQEFAQQAIESVLASRRLEKITRVIA